MQMEEMMKRIIGVSLVSAALTASSLVGAQEFAKPGQVVIGAERLTGVYYEQYAVSAGNQKQTTHTTKVALLGMPSGFSLQSLLAGPAPTPRLAVDVFVIQGLSLGGSVMYLNDSGSYKTENPPQPNSTTDLPTTSTFIFSPRVGYALQVGQNFAIWPRAGATYSNFRITTRNTNGNPPPATTETKASTDFTEASLEFMMAILPVDHFAILVGPYIDIPLGGGQKRTVDGVTDPVRPDVNYLSAGLSVGLAGFF
jgi:hypothetical protein